MSMESGEFIRGDANNPGSNNLGGSVEKVGEAGQKSSLENLLTEYGNILFKDPDYGKPGHDVEIMTLTEAQLKCPPLISALLRASSPEQLQAMVDIYKVG
ncbi:hypothetical protein H0X09_02325 [Candidatus Saccharibacteria bacterium]|nr:hypothetical protein [Candidatus Saccharibacteria bacterium]